MFMTSLKCFNGQRSPKNIQVSAPLILTPTSQPIDIYREQVKENISKSSVMHRNTPHLNFNLFLYIMIWCLVVNFWIGSNFFS